MKDVAHHWSPISDLPHHWASYASPELTPLADAWHRYKKEVEQSDSFRQDFMEKMRREIAIETGIIERLYTLDRGVTESLIEHGITASLISHDKNDTSAEQIVALIHDQAEAVDWLFDFVTRKRKLTISFIRELHQLLTRHQKTTPGRDTQGNVKDVEIIRGDWKKWPNNPLRPDGRLHEYCPPEHVASEMDQLLQWHEQHRQNKIPPEIEAAWLHHRFTQIHPFQDGNGRVVRCLASIVFIRAGYFPLVIRESDRAEYIQALEQADQGSLHPLVFLFSAREKEAFNKALNYNPALPPHHTSTVMKSIRERLTKAQHFDVTENTAIARQLASSLFDIALYKAENEKRHLEQAFQGLIRDFQTYISFGKSDDPIRANYFSYQIRETAKRLQYFPNTREYSSWVRLTIKTQTQVEILIAFHPLGRENFGIFAASACAYQKTRETKETEVEEGQPIFVSLETLSKTYFQFSYKDTAEGLRPRFDRWLDEILSAGLVYWQRDL